MKIRSIIPHFVKRILDLIILYCIREINSAEYRCYYKDHTDHNKLCEEMREIKYNSSNVFGNFFLVEKVKNTYFRKSFTRVSSKANDVFLVLCFSACTARNFVCSQYDRQFHVSS